MMAKAPHPPKMKKAPVQTKTSIQNSFWTARSYKFTPAIITIAPSSPINASLRILNLLNSSLSRSGEFPSNKPKLLPPNISRINIKVKTIGLGLPQREPKAKWAGQPLVPHECGQLSGDPNPDGNRADHHNDDQCDCWLIHTASFGSLTFAGASSNLRLAHLTPIFLEYQSYGLVKNSHSCPHISPIINLFCLPRIERHTASSFLRTNIIAKSINFQSVN